MTKDEHLLAMEGARFFGEISASISHEIKNVLAILNENSGLLKDLVQMNSKGAPIEPEKLMRLSASIDRQVKRADGIVKNMNGFAHSADAASELVDLGEVVGFVAQLGSRLIQMRQAKFAFESPDKPVKCFANRFFLENLIWLCMTKVMDGLNLGEAIHIFVEYGESGPRIRFAGVPEIEKKRMETSLTPREEVLLEILGAELVVDSKKGELAVLLSGK